ncbi:MAG: alpha/beta fold hydrolase [Bdellovibrionaceae bacterium]|nr:alpha/beta fold hydrolase [Pseudobdellovibrionaceae bacterium]
MGRPVDVTLVALHGFLGEPSDWDAALADLPSAVRVVIPDYTRDLLLNPGRAGLSRWGLAFQDWRRREGLRDAVILAGYSQGGRLALHALEADPAGFRAVICLSTNEGLPDEDLIARQARRQSDEEWARRFSGPQWADALKDWNAQPVFQGGSVEPRRTFRPDTGEVTTACLRQWSLAQQKNFRPLIAREKKLLHWWVGEKDEKFRRQARELRQAVPDLDVRALEGAGHRLLWDSPRQLGRLLNEVIGEQAR